MERLVKEWMVFDHVQVQTRKKKEALRLISYLCAKESGIYAGKLLEAFEEREYLILPAAEKELRCPMPGSAE